MASYRSPFAVLPDEHMRLVGIIAAHWEFLDVVLQRALAETMQHDHHRVALLTENMTFAVKIDLLTSYVRMLKDEHPKVWKDFGRIVETLRRAHDFRNMFVHARWKEGNDATIPCRVVAKIKGGKFDIVDEPSPIGDLEGAARYILDAGDKLTEFFQQFGLLTT